MKGLFIPGITAKMFRDASVESVAELITEGKIYDIDYQEPCKDCVSRTELLSRIDAERKHLLDLKMDGAEHIVVHHARQIIEELPPATPKRKVGEWIKKNNDYFDWYECSECGYGSDGEMKYNRLCDVRTKFCPDCGSQNLKGE